MLQSTSPQGIKLITKLFNTIVNFEIRDFPTRLELRFNSTNLQGKRYYPDNYRGITLNSCLGKLYYAQYFTIVLPLFLRKKKYTVESKVNFVRTTEQQTIYLF